MSGTLRHRVALLGCGLIGESWAALMTAHGHDAVLWDPAEGALAGIAERVAALRGQVVMAAEARLPEPGRLLIAGTAEEAAAQASWVQENAPENAALKIELYRRVERAAPPETPIASSTSSLTWSELAPGLERPARLLTAHPFNPPHLMPLVEVYSPDDAVRAAAVEFYAGMGREVVLLRRDMVGHIANRLSSALWREAVHLVAEDVADVAAIDAALVHGPGLRWSVIGAHLAYHLGGGAGGIEAYLRHLGPSQERRWASLGTPALTAELCERLVRGVEAEAAGRPIPELAAQRDRALIRMLAVRREERREERGDER